jgi:hypothetical protein
VKRAGPTFWPAIGLLVVPGAILFVSETTWLQMTMASLVIVGIALAVFAIATPEFLERDAEADD